jgi:hypothetical protein
MTNLQKVLEGLSINQNEMDALILSHGKDIRDLQRRHLKSVENTIEMAKCLIQLQNKVRRLEKDRQ